MINLKYAAKIEFIPEREFLVIKGYGKLYDPDVTSDIISDDENTWNIIKQRIADGSVERLKKTADSEAVFMLFCNTCVRNDEEKCYVCSYDIACENLADSKPVNGFEIVRLNACDYVVFDCEFNDETTMEKAHEQPDKLFWGEWLNENSYKCAIDDPTNCTQCQLDGAFTVVLCHQRVRFALQLSLF